ncbi:MAG: hypothetical protein PHU21_02945 [Elusimicrobia bacterium]|nr:hypothetical protein [Elusimicrobiota bacterium]
MHKPGGPQIDPKSAVILAMDTAVKKDDATHFERAYYLCRADDLGHQGNGDLRKVRPETLFSDENQELLSGAEGVYVVVYPTRTYSEGMGGNLLSEISPEDRSFIRAVRQRFHDAVCCKVPLHETAFFEGLKGYFLDDREKKQYQKEKHAKAEAHARPAPRKKGLIEFDMDFFRNMKAIFKSCMTKPNQQDFRYLIYKTFGLNLGVRLVFMIASVQKGELPVMRAVISTSWYQLQDAVFTVFGQTYMKFLGKMTGLLRVYKAYFGDLFFVYFQLCGFEFLNRLVLGPLGENPLAYTWSGIGLIFLNIMQGMLSGGPLIPAINQMRKTGCISHNTMMHLYQLSSLTMQFGLFASFGYQWFYTVLTTSVLVLAWGSYAAFTTFFRDPEFVRVHDKGALARLDGLAARCFSLPS